MACLAQAPSIAWWMPCFVAKYDRVSSSFSASSATLALKPAKYRFRFPVIRTVLQRSRTYPGQLSEFPAPPQTATFFGGDDLHHGPGSMIAAEVETLPTLALLRISGIDEFSA